MCLNVGELPRIFKEIFARAALVAASAEEVHAIAAFRLCELGMLDHPDIGDWLRTAVEDHVPEGFLST